MLQTISKGLIKKSQCKITHKNSLISFSSFNLKFTSNFSPLYIKLQPEKQFFRYFHTKKQISPLNIKFHFNNYKISSFNGQNIEIKTNIEQEPNEIIEKYDENSLGVILLLLIAIVALSLLLQPLLPFRLVGEEVGAEEEDDIQRNRRKNELKIKKLYEEGLSHYNKKEYEISLQLFNEALQLDPQNQFLLNAKGFSLFMLQRYEESIIEYKKAIYIDDENDIFYFNLATSLRTIGRNEEALIAIDDAIALDDSMAEFHNTRGSILLGLGDIPKALISFHTSIKLAYKSLYLNNTGYAYSLLGDHEGALKYYQEAIKLDPANKLAYSNKKISLEKLNRFKEADELEIDYYYYLARKHLIYEDFASAIEMYFEEGKSYINRNKEEEGEISFRNALDIFKDHGRTIDPARRPKIEKIIGQIKQYLHIYR